MNKFRWDKKYIYWGVTAFLVILACLICYWIIQRWSGIQAQFADITKILQPIIWGLVIAYLLTPLVKFFQKTLPRDFGERLFKKNPDRAPSFRRGIAVAIAVILMLGIIFTLFRIVLPQLYWSIVSIVSNLSGAIGRVIAWANKWLEDYPEMKKGVTQLVGDIGTNLTDWAQNTLLEMKTVVESVSAGVISVFKALVNFFVAVVVSIYLMFSREKFIAQGKKALYSVLSPERSNGVMRTLRFTNKSFMGYFSGQLLDALIVGILCYIGCVIIGIKDAVLIAVIIGITNIIPFFGPFIGGIPSALIVLMYSPMQCLIFIAFIIVLQQVDGNIISPRILGNVTGLSGFWVIFAILVGSGLLGPIGMIVGVPLFVVVYAAVKYLIRKKLKKRGLPLETGDYVNLDYIDPETNAAVPIEPEEVKKEEKGPPGDTKGEKAPWHDEDKK